jgi:hypothetical protein
MVLCINPQQEAAQRLKSFNSLSEHSPRRERHASCASYIRVSKDPRESARIAPPRIADEQDLIRRTGCHHPMVYCWRRFNHFVFWPLSRSECCNDKPGKGRLRLLDMHRWFCCDGPH